jgi:serine/threonine protein kinase
MKMKRQREGDISARRLSSFGKDYITELSKKGNPSFARGAFGSLTVGIRKQTSDPNGVCHLVAIKTIERALVVTSDSAEEEKISEEVIGEVTALLKLGPHENIVSLVGLYAAKSMSKSALSLIFPYSSCDLHTTLEWRRRTFLPLLPLDVIKTITRDLFTALHHCHDAGFLHRDVKPGNLLVDRTGVVKLCDFGLAKRFLGDDSKSTIELSTTEVETKGLCTLYYRPPEILFGGSASEASVDMYSAGAVIAELISGKVLFQGKNVLDQLSLIFDMLGTPTETSWKSWKSLPDSGKLTFATKTPQPWQRFVPRITEDKTLHDMFCQLVTLDPYKRLSTKQVLEHEWLVSSRPEGAQRSQLRNELIPPRLREPRLLVPESLSVASRVALQLAEKRRTFLDSPSMSAWTGPDIPEESIVALLGT